MRLSLCVCLCVCLSQHQQQAPNVGLREYIRQMLGLWRQVSPRFWLEVNCVSLPSLFLVFFFSPSLSLSPSLYMFFSLLFGGRFACSQRILSYLRQVVRCHVTAILRPRHFRGSSNNSNAKKDLTTTMLKCQSNSRKNKK